MDKREKEVRNILTGLIRYAVDGSVIVAANNLLESDGQDFFAGADKVRLFGLRRELQQYRVEGDVDEAHIACMEGLLKLGRQVSLLSAPEAFSVLCMPLGLHPLVVTLEADERALLQCIYTARSPLSALSVKWARKRLAEAFPSALKPAELTMKPACIEPDEPDQKDAKDAKDAKNKKAKQEQPAKPERTGFHRINKKRKEKQPDDRTKQ